MAPTIDSEMPAMRKEYHGKALQLAGKKGKCPVCGKVINIPDPKVKADTLFVNEDVSNAEVKKVAAAIAGGTMLREKKKKGFFARLFGRK